MGSTQLFNERSGRLVSIGKAPASSQFSNVIARLGKGVQTIVYYNSKDKAIQAAIDYASRERNKDNCELDALAKKIKNQVHKDYFLVKLIK